MVVHRGVYEGVRRGVYKEQVQRTQLRAGATDQESQQGKKAVGVLRMKKPLQGKLQLPQNH